MKHKQERRKPINKLYPYAVRVQIWTPDGFVKLDGPSDKSGCAAILKVALDNTGDKKKDHPNA